MSQRLAVVFVVAASLVVGACGGDDDKGAEEKDTGVAQPSDAQVRNDATTPRPDAGKDAGSTPDAAPSDDLDAGDDDDDDDAAVVDAGFGVDANVDAGVDAAAHDAGDAGGDAGDAGDGGADASLPKPTAAGQIVITEIQSAPLGYSDDLLGEWVEIYNPSATVTYDLTGCTFSDKAGDTDFTFAGTHIGPKQFLALTSGAFTVALNGFVSDAVYGADSKLSASSDGPNIVCNAVVIDKVEYGAAAGFAVPSTMEGHTIQLSSSKLDATANDVGANWCFGTAKFFTTTTSTGDVSDYGTPKAANYACP